MYHGIIEHVIFMVPWLEKQIRERRLDEGHDMGRIYRVVTRGTRSIAVRRASRRRRPRISSRT